MEIEKFLLETNETLIGKGLVAFQNGSKTGTIYVTNQRVCFHESLTNFVYMKLPLSEVAGYRYDRNYKKYTFSGFPVKKLQGWLQRVGIPTL